MHTECRKQVELLLLKGGEDGEEVPAKDKS